VTNGFDISRVNDAMEGRLGWLQPTLPGSPSINDANKGSKSGRYYNDGSFHATLTIDKIKSTQENASISDTDFNALLTRLDQAATMRCLNAVFNRPQLVEHSLLYERASNIRNVVIPNGGNFCGYRIKVAKGDWAVQLNSVSLYFDKVATFKLYLFNDLIASPVAEKQVTTQANSQVIVDLDWAVSYVSSANSGGLFYIGYFQDDLGDARALDEQLNIWENTKIFGAYPFQSPRISGALNFNRTNPSVVFKTYGLNLEVSSYKDYTRNIVQNAHLFDNARGLSMAIRVMEEIKYSSRTNAIERQGKEAIDKADLNLDLNLAAPSENLPFVAGLKAQLLQELSRISRNFFPKAQASSVNIAGGCDTGVTDYDTFNLKNLPPRERIY
jgi:hypothetical protein